jgi:predicted RNA-binding protein (TIGR00451 family)
VSSAAPTCRQIIDDDLIRIKAVADYQFGAGCGETLFPNGVTAIKSKKTGKIKGIYHNDRLLATLRPSDGHLALSVDGARLLTRALDPPRYRIIVQDSVLDFIKQGRNLFSKHIVSVDTEIRPGEEVLITDSKDHVVAVGRAILNGAEMKRFKIGLAAKVRKGSEGVMEAT